jgi:hypothetical protein
VGFGTSLSVSRPYDVDGRVGMNMADWWSGCLTLLRYIREESDLDSSSREDVNCDV